jgi:ribosomal protein L4
MLVLKTEIIPFISDALDNVLTKAAIQRELIITDEKFRGTGKTTALVEFAKKHGFYVVVNTGIEAKELRAAHRYGRVYSVRELQHVKRKPVVIDECVDKSEVERMGFEVITGYLCVAKPEKLSEKQRVLLKI